MEEVKDCSTKLEIRQKVGTPYPDKPCVRNKAGMLIQTISRWILYETRRGDPYPDDETGRLKDLHVLATCISDHRHDSAVTHHPLTSQSCQAQWKVRNISTEALAISG